MALCTEDTTHECALKRKSCTVPDTILIRDPIRSLVATSYLLLLLSLLFLSLLFLAC